MLLYFGPLIILFTSKIRVCFPAFRCWSWRIKAIPKENTLSLCVICANFTVISTWSQTVSMVTYVFLYCFWWPTMLLKPLSCIYLVIISYQLALILFKKVCYCYMITFSFIHSKWLWSCTSHANVENRLDINTPQNVSLNARRSQVAVSDGGTWYVPWQLR